MCPRLKVKWAFGFPGDASANRNLLSLVDESSSAASAERSIRSTPPPAALIGLTTPARSIRNAVTIGKVGRPQHRLFRRRESQRPRASTPRPASPSGRSSWTSIRWRASPAAPNFYNGRLYVPISSIEEASAMAAEVRMLHVPRQRRRARRRNRQSALEILHRSRSPQGL